MPSFLLQIAVIVVSVTAIPLLISKWNVTYAPQFLFRLGAYTQTWLSHLQAVPFLPLYLLILVFSLTTVEFLDGRLKMRTKPAVFFLPVLVAGIVLSIYGPVGTPRSVYDLLISITIAKLVRVCLLLTGSELTIYAIRLYWLMLFVVYSITTATGEAPRPPIIAVLNLPRRSGFLSDPNSLGGLVAIGAISSLAIASHSIIQRKMNERVALSGCIAFSILLLLCGYFLLDTFSRGALLAFVISCIYYATYVSFHLHNLRRVVQTGAIIIASVSVLLLAIPPLSWRNAVFYRFSPTVARSDIALVNRVTATSAAIQIIATHPAGVGWDAAIPRIDRIVASTRLTGDALLTNSYLYLAVAAGLSCSLSLLAYVAYCFVAALRGMDSLAEDVLLQGGLVACAICGSIFMFCDGKLFGLAVSLPYWTSLELARPFRNSYTT